MGGMVAQMLTKIINGEPIEQNQVILTPSIIVRQSTGAPR